MSGRKIRIALVASAVLGVTSAISSAGKKKLFGSATSCVIYYGSPILPHQNSGFIESISTDGVSVSCLLNPSYSYANPRSNGTRIYIRDGNAQFNKPVGCTLTHSGISLPTVYSCSTPGGCSSGNNTYVTATGTVDYLDLGSFSGLDVDPKGVSLGCVLPQTNGSITSRFYGFVFSIEED
jgi:hypothetical protein